MISKEYFVKQLSIRISEKAIVEDISFHFEKGETLGLFGESGSGKSTLARFLAKQLSSRASLQYQGLSLPEKVSLVHQNPLLSFNPVLNIRSQLQEARVAGGNELLSQKELEKVLLEVGISNPANRLSDSPINFSGGELQRIAILRALLFEPELLILDEATSALDEDYQDIMFKFVEDYRSTRNCTVALISHSLDLLKKHTHRAIFIDQGRILEQGTTQQLFLDPNTEKLKRLVQARGSFSKQTVSLGSSTPSMLSFSDCYVFDPARKNKFALVSVRDFELRQGEALGLIAPSGTGKSSFLKGLLGIYPSRILQLKFEGKKVKRNKLPNSVKRQLGYVLQDPRDSFDPTKSVYASLHFVAQKKIPEKDQNFEIESVLRDVGLNKEITQRLPTKLSGGQLQRASIARAILTSPKVLFLDEPTSALDQENEVLILELLQSLRKKYGLTIFLISHSSFVTKAVTDRVISL